MKIRLFQGPLDGVEFESNLMIDTLFIGLADEVPPGRARVGYTYRHEGPPEPDVLAPTVELHLHLQTK